MADKITDYDARSKALLASQFQGKTNIEALLETFSTEVQTLEDLLFDFFSTRSLDVAAGVQMDGIGEIIGQSRDGRTDDELRSAIRLQIRINLSSGDPETLISVFSSITNANVIEYREYHPATVRMHSDGDEMPDAMHASLQRLAPAGVHLVLSMHISSASHFGFSDDYSASGFGEVGETIGGELVEGFY